MINYIIGAIIPLMILMILIIAIKEKKDILKLFIEGVVEGLKTVYNIFPYILSITIAIGLLRETKAINLLLYPVQEILVKLNIPSNIIPLCILRPLSGGAAMSTLIDIFKENGPDSLSGKIASIIMGSTETTFYTITVLFGAVGIKKNRGVLIAGLIADSLAVISAIVIVNLWFI